VAKRLKSKFAIMAVVPAWFLWITVTSAIIWFMVVVMPTSVQKTPGAGYTVAAIMIAMLILNFMFIWDFVRMRKKD
jgi:carbon starvation protein